MTRVFLLLAALVVAACATATEPIGFTTPPDEAFGSAHKIARAPEVPKQVGFQEPWVPDGLSLVDTAVAIEILVGADGTVIGSRYAQGDRRFFSNVAAAAQRWRFEPLLVAGQPTPFVVPVAFTMKWSGPPVVAEIRVRWALPE